MPGRSSAERILKPAYGLNATLPGGRQDCLEHVIIAKIGCAGALEDSVPIVLRMNRGVIPAVECAGVVFLFAVVRQGLTG